MDAAFMSFQRHGWGIHVVSASRGGATGRGSAVTGTSWNAGASAGRPWDEAGRAALGGNDTNGTSTPHGAGGVAGVWFARAEAARYAREREAMTSRQPGTVPRGSTAGVGVPGGGDRAAGDRAGGDRAGAALTAQDWLLRLLPLTLLIIAGLAGLRGAVGDLQWNGPLHR